MAIVCHIDSVTSLHPICTAAAVKAPRLLDRLNYDTTQSKRSVEKYFKIRSRHASPTEKEFSLLTKNEAVFFNRK